MQTTLSLQSIDRLSAPADPDSASSSRRRSRRLREIDPTASTATAPSTEGRKLMLVFEHRMVDLVADRVGSRFKQLARLVGRSGSIVRR
jgi:hypothetical protein